MSFLCFKCKKNEPPSKGKDHQRDSSNSTSDESDPIVKKPKSPPKTRQSQLKVYTSSSASGSFCVAPRLSDLAPPPACLPTAARSPGYLNVSHNHNELYTDSFLIYQPNTPMQFFMELPGTVDDSNYIGSSSDDDDYPAYDYPKNNRLISLEQGSGDVMAAHQHALAPDEGDSSTSGVFSGELPPINEGTLHTEQHMHGLCTQYKLKNVLKWQGTPPFPRKSKALSLWIPAVTSGCDDVMTKPRPCSLPGYVNFKGHYSN